MVHALREAWRVSVRGGTLLDLRPVAEPYPIEVVRETDVTVVGTIESTEAATLDDAASDAAVREVVREGLFVARRTLELEYALWWDTADELHASFASWTRRHVTPPTATIERARRELEARGRGTRLRSRGHLILSVYDRLAAPSNPSTA
jgi:hypothetical protein